jgi:hypothetical protein
MYFSQRHHQEKLDAVRNIDRLIQAKKKGEQLPLDHTWRQLMDARDAAFRELEQSTVEHILALVQLKRELRLFTDHSR